MTFSFFCAIHVFIRSLVCWIGSAFFHFFSEPPNAQLLQMLQFQFQFQIFILILFRYFLYLSLFFLSVYEMVERTSAYFVHKILCLK